MFFFSFRNTSLGAKAETTSGKVTRLLKNEDKNIKKNLIDLLNDERNITEV